MATLKFKIVRFIGEWAYNTESVYCREHNLSTWSLATNKETQTQTAKYPHTQSRKDGDNKKSAHAIYKWLKNR